MMVQETDIDRNMFQWSSDNISESAEVMTSFIARLANDIILIRPLLNVLLLTTQDSLPEI